MSELVQPLRQYARSEIAARDIDVVMVVHDWSKLSYGGHESKADQAQLAQENNRGYEMMSALAVSGKDGAPLAPMEVHLKTADGILSTRESAQQDVNHHEQILLTMEASCQWNLGAQVLHVIDREADSVGHFRSWNAAGHYFLVRGHDHRVVQWEGQKKSRKQVVDTLTERGEFQPAGTAMYQGKCAELWVAETEVVLDRPARTMVVGEDGKRKQVSIKGIPLPLRLIVVQVRNAKGKVLATWYLLSNAPSDVLSAKRLARCYYWRWRIESYFKLLKSHGQQLEQWLQETGARIMRRMLVASMACVTVWHLLADNSPEATELKKVLVTFSGRQTKRAVPFTAPALLAGFWMLLAMNDYLEKHDPQDLKNLVRNARLPFSLTPGG